MEKFENKKSSLVGVANAPNSILRQGRMMFERYRLERLLGVGGMGVVWLATDRTLDRPVALKFLPEIFFQDPAARDDMKSETRRSLELTHPHIVRIYDFLEDDQAAAISMEYVDGATLTHLRLERPQRCFEAAGLHAWLADLCSALDYAHITESVVHRDLKPANLMVTSKGSLKIADFGISHSVSSTMVRVTGKDFERATGGTLGYMSPQQLEGELPSASDDIYSLGATLYELITGKPPFYSGDISLQIRSIMPNAMIDRRLELGTIGEEIPENWENTIAACLAKNPRDRPATAYEVARNLGVETNRVGEPVTQADPSTMVVSLDSLAAEQAQEDRVAAESEFGVRLKPLLRTRYLVPACVLGFALVLAPFIHFSQRRLPSIGAAPAKPPATAIAAANANTATPAPAPAQSKGAVEAPAGQGGLTVKSNPAGAQVVVDGGDPRTSPLAIQNLREGAHSVEIRLPGYEAFSTLAQVRADQFTDLGIISLERSVGTLQVASEPAGLDYQLLTVGGDHEIRHGQTPESIPRLPTGDYRLRVLRAGWPAQEQVVTVGKQSGQVASFRFGNGTLQVTTDPAGAEVLSEGKSLGKTPLNVQIPSGHYEGLTAQLADFQPQKFSADVLAEDTVILPPLVLKPLPASVAISTTPSGVPFQIFADADGQPSDQPLQMGFSPANVDNLAPGNYRVVFGGGQWKSRTVTCKVGEHGKTALSQEFPFGTLKIDSHPAGADVLDGETLLGQTPLSVPVAPGSHALQVTMEGKRPSTRTLTVAVNQTKSSTFELKSGGTTASSKSEDTVVHHHHKKKKKGEESDNPFVQFGHAIKNFFSGKQPPDNR